MIIKKRSLRKSIGKVFGFVGISSYCARVNGMTRALIDIF